jgi:hypothetical protein
MEHAPIGLTAIATGSILYDGLSQTQSWHNIFGTPDLPIATFLLAVFLCGTVALVMLVGRVVGLTAMGAGLLPIAVGYLLAHYLTYLLGDGQRIVAAVSDPFRFGWDLLGTAAYEPNPLWIQSSLVWSFQLVAVIGGHVVGAWAGHVVAGGSHRRRRTDFIHQMPLAFAMVLLTTTTLWSLGQASRDGGQAPQAANRGPVRIALPLRVLSGANGRPPEPRRPGAVLAGVSDQR